MLIRSGLSPAVTSSAAALSGPTPEAARRAGLVCAQRRRILVSSWLISVVEGLVSAGQVPQGPLRVCGCGVCFTGTERCTDSYVCSDIGAP